MKPILYAKNATSFTSNGLGVLSDAISCTVTEERNGVYELEMTYPITGIHYSDIDISKIIKVLACKGKSQQCFRIYAVTKPINGIVTINAEHISYQLAYIPVAPFTAGTVVAALSGIDANAMAPCPFSFWTDKTTEANYRQEIPDNIRSRLGGTAGSILDVYGGEYEFDNYQVKLHNNRGSNRDVTLRYGKNITDIKQEENIASTYTSIVGYWKGETSEVHTSVIDSASASSFPYKRVKIVDFSSDFETEPEVPDLTAKATSYMNSHNFGVPSVSIDVSFIALHETEEYKNIAPLERVYLCDTVNVEFTKLGISATAKVVKTVFNVLLERYDTIELGDSRTNLSKQMIQQKDDTQEQIDELPTKSFLEKAIDAATQALVGQKGGYLKFNYRNNEPYEMLIMDHDNEEDAVVIWRYNLAGWGVSTDGGQNYEMAATLNSTYGASINANYIIAGTMLANRIRAGLLEDESHTNYWDLTTGAFRLTSNTIFVNKSPDYSGAYVPSTSNSPASGWTAAQKKSNIGKTFLNTNTDALYMWTEDTSTTPTSYRWVALGTTIGDVMGDLEDQIDHKIETWYQSTDPSLSWSASEKIAHTGDLWYNTSTTGNNVHKTFRWTGSAWQEQEVSKEVFDDIDGKAQIFYFDPNDTQHTHPEPPYNVGDTWYKNKSNGDPGDILTCIVSKPNQYSSSYDAADWAKKNKYTDDSAVDALDNSLDQAEVFARLTNNMQNQGIELDETTGRLYINASMIASGVLQSNDDAYNPNFKLTLSDGSVVAKDFSITTPSFRLTNAGKMVTFGDRDPEVHFLDWDCMRTVFENGGLKIELCNHIDDTLSSSPSPHMVFRLRGSSEYNNPDMAVIDCDILSIRPITGTGSVSINYGSITTSNDLVVYGNARVYGDSTFSGDIKVYDSQSMYDRGTYNGYILDENGTRLKVVKGLITEQTF